MDPRYKAAIDAAHVKYEATMVEARRSFNARLADIKKQEAAATRIFETIRVQAEKEEEDAMLAALRDTRAAGLKPNLRESRKHYRQAAE